jgi:hypothetical protein
VGRRPHHRRQQVHPPCSLSFRPSARPPHTARVPPRVCPSPTCGRMKWSRASLYPHCTWQPTAPSAGALLSSLGRRHPPAFSAPVPSGLCAVRTAATVPTSVRRGCDTACPSATRAQVCLSFCRSVCLSACLPVCRSVCLSAWPRAHLSSCRGWLAVRVSLSLSLSLAVSHTLTLSLSHSLPRLSRP